MQDPPSIVGRWLDYIAQFDFTLNHVAGKENIPADFLSRVKRVDLDSDGESVVLGSVKTTRGEQRELQNKCVWIKVQGF